MRTSKRKFEGCMIIDHRESPGLTPEQVQGKGPVVGQGQYYESATITCCHCQGIVWLNPNRTRPRAYCQKCDDYQCDLCAALPCKPFAQVMDEMIQAAQTGQPYVLPARFQ